MDDQVFDLLRPADLLVARITLRNLTLHADRLVRTTAGEAARIVLTFPPQHLREQILVIGNPIGVAAAAPSSLELVVPDGVSELPLGPDGLWGVCSGLDVGDGERLGVPARVGLSPRSAHWSLPPRPHTVAAGTDLWRARLDSTTDGGQVSGQLVISEVHDSDVPAWQVLPTGADLRQRLGGVMTATRFDLSALGASVRMRGPVAFDPAIVDPASVSGFLDSYEHQIDFGRDSHVKVVSHGHLSSGHPATLVSVANRVFVAGPAPITPDGRPQESNAGLSISRMIVVDDPVLSVERVSEAYGALDRDMPFRTLTLLTTQVGGLTSVPDTGAFWVRRAGGDVPFAMQGTDWAGAVTNFSLPLIFIPNGAFDADQFVSIFDASNPARHQASLAASTVTLADAGGRPDAHASVVVDFARFSITPVDPGLFGHVTAAPVLPFVGSVGVVLEAVTQFTGQRRTIEATWHDTYRAVGLDRASNALGAYLRLPTEIPLSMDTQRVGGLAKPDMVLGAVTAVKGAVPAGFELGSAPDAATILARFAGAKILGVIDLTAVIGVSDLLPPELHTTATPEQVEVRYHWKAPIRAEQTTLLKPDGPSPSITLDGVTTRRIADGQTTAKVEGTLQQVALDFAGVVKLHFDTLRFTAIPGRQPEIVPSGMTLEFSNELAFLNDLRAALASAGLAKGASVDVRTDRITAGFSAALPSLSCGVFMVTNLAVSSQLTIPFDGRPVEFRFSLAERFSPFGLSYSMFTGGGFFALALDSHGITRVEAALEFGGSLSLDIVVAKGSVFVMAGIYFVYDAVSDAVRISGYLRAGGQLNVLGIVTVSASFYMQLSYDLQTKRVVGRATLTIGIKVLFISKSVTLSVERSFVASALDPAFTDCFELEDWEEYCRAFA